MIVDFFVNNEQTFRIVDEIKVKAGEEILDSEPTQIETLSVELVK